jgi:UDP:flavonoid glycosyltransferase YjiC (YdhE family)
MKACCACMLVDLPHGSTRLSPKAKIYLSVSSEGYGHSSRAMALAAHLPPTQVVMASYGLAQQRLQRQGFRCLTVPQEIKLVGNAGKFDMGRTILRNPQRALSFNQVVQTEQDALKQEGATLVIADGRMAPVVAASRLHIPCVVLTNQSAFYPFFDQDSPLIKLLGLSFEWLMQFWLSSAEEIWIPDFPPPDTVCLPNLSPDMQVKKRTRFVGPLVAWQPADLATPPELEALLAQPDRPPVVVASLGGHGYRRPLFDAVVDAARHMPHHQFHVFSGFLFAESQGPLPNLTLHSIEEEAAPYLKAADIVVSQAGHSTAMELLTLGQPSILIPDHQQIEQENNARRMTELGVALSLTYDQLEAGELPQTLHTALQCNSLRSHAQGFAQRAHQWQAPQQAAHQVAHYAQRILDY